MTKRTCSASLAGCLLIAASHPAQAGVTINATEVAGNVEIVASGTLNLSGLENFSLSSASRQVYPSRGYVVVGSGGIVDLYRGMTGPTTFGPGGQTLAAGSTGGLFAITNYGSWLAVPNGFASGSNVSSSAFFPAATFDSLGLMPGTYTWTWGSDSVTLQVTAVPEPSLWVLTIVGLGLVGWAARRRTTHDRHAGA